MFINCSNHKSKFWDDDQIKAAEKWGEIKDYLFPIVPPKATEEEVDALANKVVEELMSMKPDAVMCQGEFTLTFAVATKLKENGIEVVSACSERQTIERQLEDGSTEKRAKFHFVKFRKY